jgi:hypothetical protein
MTYQSTNTRACIHSLLLAAGLLLSGCDSGPDTSTAAPVSDAVAEQQAREAALVAQRQADAKALDDLIAAMQPVYQELESERKRATRLHERLTRRFARQTMPSEHAAEIVKIMSDVSYQLRNPKQLGAFKTVEGVQSELQKMKLAGAQLDQVNVWVPEQR